LTGLGTYRVADVPSWYRNAAETEHWAAQAQFWEAIAQVCVNLRGVFAYNLINEPRWRPPPKGRPAKDAPRANEWLAIRGVH